MCVRKCDFPVRYAKAQMMSRSDHLRLVRPRGKKNQKTKNKKQKKGAYQLDLKKKRNFLAGTLLLFMSLFDAAASEFQILCSIIYGKLQSGSSRPYLSTLLSSQGWWPLSLPTRALLVCGTAFVHVPPTRCQSKTRRISSRGVPRWTPRPPTQQIIGHRVLPHSVKHKDTETAGLSMPTSSIAV